MVGGRLTIAHYPQPAAMPPFVLWKKEYSTQLQVFVHTGHSQE